jgi:hypothetical protein
MVFSICNHNQSACHTCISASCLIACVFFTIWRILTICHNTWVSYHTPHMHFLPHATHVIPAFLPYASHVHFLPHGTCAFLTTRHTCISYQTPHMHFCRMPNSTCIFYHMACVHFSPHATPAFLTTRHTCISAPCLTEWAYFYHMTHVHFLPYATHTFLATRHTCISTECLACEFFYHMAHVHCFLHATHAFLPHATLAFLPHASQHVHVLPHDTCAFLTTRHTCNSYQTPHLHFCRMPHLHSGRMLNMCIFLTTWHMHFLPHATHKKFLLYATIREFLTQMPIVHYCHLSSPLGISYHSNATDALLTTRHT